MGKCVIYKIPLKLVCVGSVCILPLAFADLTLNHTKATPQELLQKIIQKIVFLELKDWEVA